jgi:hypothetical protein
MVAIVLADAVLEKFGGDHLSELLRNVAAFNATVGPRERIAKRGGGPAGDVA